MSRLISGWLAVGLAAALAAPAAVTGQQTEQEVRNELKALVPRLKAAHESVTEAHTRLAREREDANGTLDTLMVGPLRVLVFPGQEEVARDVVGTVWRRDFAGWVDHSPSLAGYAFFFQWAAHPRRFIPPHSRVVAITGSLDDSRQYMETGVRTAVSPGLEWDLQTSVLKNWASSVVSPPPGPWLYRQMVTTPSVAVRSCIAGSVKACVSAAGLVEDDYPLADWYTPSERLQVGLHYRSRWGLTATAGCVRGDIKTCDAALKSQLDARDYAWAIPLSSAVRGSLVRFALEQGGHGAWGRLIDASNPSIAAALSNAAGMPVEELVAKWRTWILRQRPVANAGIGEKCGITLLWIVLLGTLAMRSTRWRLG